MLFNLIKKNFFFLFLPVVISLFTFTPLLQKGSGTIKLLLWFLVVLYCFKQHSIYMWSRLKAIRNYGFLYVGVCILYIVLHISEGTIMSSSMILRFMLPVFLFILINEKLEDRQLKFLFHVFLFVIAVNIVDNIRLSILHPVESYMMMENILEEEGFTDLNIGGTAFMNMSVFFLNIVLFSYFNSTDKLEKILFIFYVVLQLIFVVFFTYKASVVLYSFLSVVLQFIAHRSRNPQQSIILTLVIGSLVYFLRDILIQTVLSAVDSDRLADRLLLLTNEDSSSGDNTSITERSELWMVSIRTWFSGPISFLFGIGNHVRSEMASTASTGIGNHSDFLDVFARYGLIGGYLLYAFFIKLYKYFKLATDKHFEVISFAIIILLFGFTKKILLPEIGFILFVVFPLCFSIYSTSFYSEKNN